VTPERSIASAVTLVTGLIASSFGPAIREPVTTTFGKSSTLAGP
jgi:hypothetical protein